ncbi:hypothetical protein BCR43DRAFT_492252 [Syncephalastrum racemosum]|uniref:Uncharacterized protein n=1 Tax=Syncephalastrum racemosum TaxID=13706 RepID=A0A1X2HD92_SYNRA|nr:hypothetical protein BCR43DRAFT_492252 [Syncephalastrum racemosum]
MPLTIINVMLVPYYFFTTTRIDATTSYSNMTMPFLLFLVLQLPTLFYHHLTHLILIRQLLQRLATRYRRRPRRIRRPHQHLQVFRLP